MRPAVYGECAERIRSTDGGPGHVAEPALDAAVAPIIAILAAIAVAACSAKAPPTVAPTTAVARPAPVSSLSLPSSDDSGLMVGRSGDVDSS